MDPDDSKTETLVDMNGKENKEQYVIVEGHATSLARNKEDRVIRKDNAECEPKQSPTKFRVPLHYSEDDEINDLYRAIPEVANHFTVTCKIGEGAFSCVYLAKLKHYPEVVEMFALKHIIPTTHPSRIENELTCLLTIGGCDNVMEVKLCLRNRDHVVFVMPVFLHDKFQEYLHNMSVEEAREYMRNLLVALKRVHQFKVIHRDVKPSNFLYNRQHKKFALVDFGLASGPILKDRDGEKQDKTATHPKKSADNKPNFAVPDNKKMTGRIPLSPSKLDPTENILVNITKGPGGKATGGKKKQNIAGKPFTLTLPSTSAASVLADNQSQCGCHGKPQICSICSTRQNQIAPRAGTAGFRAPEVLMKYTGQDTGVDIWSAGVILLSILSARYPFFRAQDDIGYLAQIIAILGSHACIKAASAIGKNLLVSEQLEPVDLKTACTKLRLSQMSFKLGPSSQNNKVIQSWMDISDEPFDLLSKMLDPNPLTRITAEDALKHEFFTNHQLCKS